MELGRSVPDQKPKLESCFRAVIEAIGKHRKLKSNRLVVGGKSMGGRVASQVVAARADEPLALDVSGLVFLGYPLHPPGNPEKLRVGHLEQIKKPMLFVQGTRDALGTPEEIQPFVKDLRPPAKIYAIEGGDHSFKAPKKFGMDQPQVYEAAMDEIARWAVTIYRHKKAQKQRRERYESQAASYLFCLAGFSVVSQHEVVSDHA
jgi:uncharacterized protein